VETTTVISTGVNLTGVESVLDWKEMESDVKDVDAK
jgi:hypothetical protein